MKNVLFITGTDTGVGKTYISTLIIKSLLNLGIKAGYFKPVETGCDPFCEDALKLSKITGQSIEESVLYQFKFPVAPYVAQIEENKKISIEKILEKIKYLSKKYEFLIVEGAGGIMVPITEEKGKIITYLDLINLTKMPVLVVSRANLGTINHTVLTVKALKDTDVQIKGIVLNRASKNPDLAEKKNPQVISRMTGIKHIFKVYENQDNLNLNDILTKIVSTS